LLIRRCAGTFVTRAFDLRVAVTCAATLGAFATIARLRHGLSQVIHIVPFLKNGMSKALRPIVNLSTCLKVKRIF